MPRAQFCDVVIASSGSLVTTARVTVYVAPPYALSSLTTQASIYTNETGAATPGNPFLATTGEIKFWADSGSYDLLIEDTGSPAKFVPKIIRYNAIPGDKGIVAAMVGDGQILAAGIATDAVGSAEIAAGAVGTSEIADASIVTADIAGKAVTAAKIEDQQAWQTLALAGFSTGLAYFKDSLGNVHWRGDALTVGGSNINSGSTLGTLIAGYRPGVTIYRTTPITTASGTSQGIVSISAAGVVTYSGTTLGAGVLVPLSIAPFRAEN